MIIERVCLRTYHAVQKWIEYGLLKPCSKQTPKSCRRIIILHTENIPVSKSHIFVISENNAPITDSKIGPYVSIGAMVAH